MARPERTKTTVAATATERAASDGSTRSPALTYTSAFQPSAPSPKTIAASTTATGPAWSAKANTTAPTEATTPTSTSVRTRRDPPPRSATEPHAMRATMAATLIAEVRDGGGQLRVPGLAHRRHEEREERLQDDDVAGRNGEQRRHAGRPQDRSERGASPRDDVRLLRRQDEREPRAARRDGGGRGCERQARAAERVERRVQDGGDGAAERDGGLPDAEGPAAPRRRVGAKEGARARDRHDRGADAEHDERPEEDVLRARARGDDEPERRERRPGEHRAAGTDPVHQHACPDQRDARAEEASP